MSDSRSLPSSLTEYVLIWCEDLLQDLPATVRTDLARTLSTRYGGGPWPARLRIQRLAEQLSGNANTFVGDLHSECHGYVTKALQKLRDSNYQARDEALELLARLSGSLELGEALDQAEQALLSDVDRADVLGRALSNSSYLL